MTGGQGRDDLPEPEPPTVEVPEGEGGVAVPSDGTATEVAGGALPDDEIAESVQSARPVAHVEEELAEREVTEETRLEGTCLEEPVDEGVGEEVQQEVGDEEVEGEDPEEGLPLLLVARGLTVHARGGSVVEPLGVVAAPGEVLLVEGTTGSGRSVLLLALAGRMRGVGGELEVAGVPGTRPRRLRAITSVARLGDVVDLDGPLTVAECVTERCLTDGVPERDGSRRMSELEDALGFRVPRDAAVGDLSMLSRVLLLVLLAQLRPAALTVLDDLDHDLSPADQVLALEHLGRLARAAGAVVVTSTVAAPDPLPPGTTLLRLPSTRPTPGDLL
ncbi:hypothetical protein [Ornithinimicrobium avium]|uniref:AAA+ ATPase domain-containing protein n=1 Tax=Ornithinimicrobium avium TaxID=2283195 RepID=A0A345NRV8_9MICO|nr:hypothetical protein [Ornithinimicrobium avium]AXH97766.1 hypothetical protein DV701_00005 [Ornithinimicrobium avium]